MADVVVIAVVSVCDDIPVLCTLCRDTNCLLHTAFIGT